MSSSLRRPAKTNTIPAGFIDSAFSLAFNPQIGADGANSLVRRQMKSDNYTESYDQMGLIATVQLSQPDADNYTAWQRFLPDGVLAVLPLSAELSSIVWSTRTAKVKQLLALGETEFVEALNEQLVSVWWTDS